MPSKHIGLGKKKTCEVAYDAKLSLYEFINKILVTRDIKIKKQIDVDTDRCTLSDLDNFKLNLADFFSRI